MAKTSEAAKKGTRKFALKSVSEANLNALEQASNDYAKRNNKHKKLHNNNSLGYNLGGDQGGVASLQPNAQLDEKESREFLRFVAEHDDPDAPRRAAERAKAERPDLYEVFKTSVKPKVPQWADREAFGFEGNVIDWIKEHHGSFNENGDWEPNLTR